MIAGEAPAEIDKELREFLAFAKFLTEHSHSTAGRDVALHAADSELIPSNPDGPRSSARSNSNPCMIAT